MELKQTRTIMDVRRGFLMTVLGVSVAGILLAGIVSNYFVHSIPIFTVCVFAIFIMMLSVFYDIFINSTYRVFLVGDDVYIYYPTYSSRAGNEFIFYKVLDVTYSTVKGSSIVFDGTVAVKSDGVEREGMKHVQNPKEMFEKVFSEENVYTIQKKFRISRIFEGENELMECLAKKKRANNKAN
ncbi:hypothetical protein OCV99_12650 [Dorea acetigenes]|jgi:hypothetical protein|uniref:DUF304 domain-containing protein n=1 Tax=Dorea acetigenes TaxID=2981787 RepID=A0ABT2RPM7_9FIRM|nr:hypothetical protein [Dorea acetigenes]MCB6416285.1 hypothetical protein [Faecalimonas umbilicata]MCU6687370.1 hypothetical protein [Dorea acetigenes]SCJ39046.1 Uncharacterised protein [uncultured Clostridium sp.]